MNDQFVWEGEQPAFEQELAFEAGGEPPAEKKQREETAKTCKGVRVLEWLERDGPGSLREYIAQLERRLVATPRLVQAHENLRKLKGMRLPRDKFEAAWRGLVRAFPEIQQYSFPPGYKVGTVKEEEAQVRCKLSRAKLAFQIWHRTGRPPTGAGFVRLCSTPPRPNGPLVLWTIDGFKPNDATLGKSQIDEIELIAQGLARSPGTRKGRPVLTIAGGFAPGEDVSAGDRRALAVKDALAAAIKRIDVSLLASVGFVLVAEPWCGSVFISMRERVPAAPDLRIRPNSPVLEPLDLRPRGTPLPPAPPPSRSSGRSAQDLLRERVDGILRKHGVKNATVRKAIINAAISGGEQALRLAVDHSGLSSPVKKAVVESIRAASRQDVQ